MKCCCICYWQLWHIHRAGEAWVFSLFPSNVRHWKLFVKWNWSFVGDWNYNNIYYFLCMVMEIENTCSCPIYPSVLGYMHFWFLVWHKKIYLLAANTFSFKAEKMLLMILLDLCDSPAFLFIIFYWLSFYHDILKEIYESRERYCALIYSCHKCKVVYKMYCWHLITCFIFSLSTDWNTVLFSLW